jgi:tripartite-type tricarboxylate transporter receptor subunit TctC
MKGTTMPLGHRALLFVACLVLAFGFGLGGTAAAQDYPSRPVRIIVQYAAGGGADFVARLLSQELSEPFGQILVVDNRAGANGAIANQVAATAAADGYTLLLGAAGPMVINPHIYGPGAVDTLKGFTPIVLVAVSPFAVTLHPSVPATSLAELTALAKAKPGALNYGTSGKGGAPHLATELYKSMAGVDLTHVPYKGLAPALAELIAGQIQVAFADCGLAAPYLKSGQLKAVAVTGAVRSSLLPELPTFAEAGLPGYQANTWYGLHAPAGVPGAVVERLNGLTRKMLTQPAAKQRLLAQGLEAADTTPTQFAAFQQAEYEKWGKVVRDADMKPE